MNYQVTVSGTYYNQIFKYEYSDYADALNMYKERINSASDMVAICPESSVLVRLLSSNDEIKKQAYLSSFTNQLIIY